MDGKNKVVAYHISMCLFTIANCQSVKKTILQNEEGYRDGTL